MCLHGVARLTTMSLQQADAEAEVLTLLVADNETGYFIQEKAGAYP